MENLKEFKVRLEERIKGAGQVFIVPHVKADLDAIASSVGMALLAKKLGQTPYLIIDEHPLAMEYGVKVVYDEIIKNGLVPVISSEKYAKLHSDNDLLITVDLNKKYLTSCQSYLSDFKNIVVIDHHKPDENTIETEDLYIDLTVSSASEIITELLCSFGVKFDKRVAEYLLAGIYLDTSTLTKNVGDNTFDINQKLKKKGAEVEKVMDLFAYDFDSDRKVHDLVNKTTFFTYTIAFALADKETKYTREELAKVADYLLKYRADASFAAGYITDELVSISARSKGKVDVGDIMKKFQGGGSPFSAAAQLEEQNMQELGMRLERTLKPQFYIDKIEEK